MLNFCSSRPVRLFRISTETPEKKPITTALDTLFDLFSLFRKSRLNPLGKPLKIQLEQVKFSKMSTKFFSKKSKKVSFSKRLQNHLSPKVSQKSPKKPKQIQSGFSSEDQRRFGDFFGNFVNVLTRVD